MKPEPKLKTVQLKTFPISATGRNLTRSPTLNSLVILISNVYNDGPFPAFLGRFPPFDPIGGSENWDRSAVGTGVSGRRQIMSLVSPVKLGRSLETSSRLRSRPL